MIRHSTRPGEAPREAAASSVSRVELGQDRLDAPHAEGQGHEGQRDDDAPLGSATLTWNGLFGP